MADSDRIAELKRKMQESAQRTKAEAEAKEAAASGAPEPSAVVPDEAPADALSAATETQSEAPAPVQAAIAEATPAEESKADSVPASEPAVAAAPAATPAATAIAQPEADAPATTTAPADAQPPAVAVDPALNGANAASNGEASAGALEGAIYSPQVLTPEELAKRDMNRREFLTYAWGGALLLVLGASGFGMFQFAYPRFKAGEFGGKFFIGPAAEVPSTEAPPLPFTAGKFWLVNTTDEGVKALYMVCTHLGCLYKWEPSTVRFECPCHGSKFSREGYYIEGPAPRSLDRFATAEEGGVLVVDTGTKIPGAPSALSPDRAEPV